MASIDFGRAFGSPYKDQSWVVKTLLGGVFAFIPIVNFVVGGALVERIKNVASGDENLPEWSDFGSMWVKGLLLAVAGFIYALPAIIIIGIGFMLAIGAAAAGGNDQSGGFAAAAGGSLCLFYFIAIIYMIAVSVLLYAAVVNFAMKGSFGAFFEFGEIFAKVREGNYFMAWIFAIIASFVYGLVGIIPFLGWLLTFFAEYLGIMTAGHLLGQWAAGVYGLPGPGAMATAPAGYAPPAAPGGYTPPPAPPAPGGYAPPPAPPAAPPAPPAPPGGSARASAGASPGSTASASRGSACSSCRSARTSRTAGVANRTQRCTKARDLPGRGPSSWRYGATIDPCPPLSSSKLPRPPRLPPRRR